MKRYTMALLGASMLASPAMATDILDRSPLKDGPISTAADSWRGPWIALGAGTMFATAEPEGEDSGLGADAIEGVLAAGYDLQFGNIVTGIVIEGRIGGYEEGVDGRGMVAARLGYAHGNVLVYGLAGLERIFAAGDGEDADGWTVGGGVDIKRANNMFYGIEARYTDLEDFEDCVTYQPEILTVTAKLGFHF